ncbi:cytoskeletal protein binding protein, partial [Coemansia guatemalensis]
IKAAPQLQSPLLAQSPSPLQSEPQYQAGGNMMPPIERGKTPDTDNLPLQLLPRQPPVEDMPPPLPPAPSSSAVAAARGPDPSKVRTWTDGTGSYTVEAEFIKLDSDGLVHLHKTNGKTISVALAKFSADDRRYVEGLLGTTTSQAPSKTARQRQQEQVRKTPGRRIINYDWDWFDFFTLKGGVSADNALKYATSFVAERLDDKSIPEITPEYMHTLGVKPDDISRLDHAFRVHSGVASESEAAPAARERPAPVQPKPTREPVREPTREPARSPIASNTTSNNPWGVDSELDRRFGRFRQIESDEAFARKLQQEEEEERRNPRSRRHRHTPHQNTQPEQRRPVDPFTSLDEPNAPSGSRPSTAGPTSGNKQPLNLGSGSRKGPGSVVDPAQLRTAMHRAASPTSNTAASGGARSPGGRTAIDEAFGTVERQSPMAVMQPEPAPPPRARPTVQHIRQASANAMRAASPANAGELTTTRMAAAAASGNTAQVQRLEQQAIAKAQELAAQEARLRQQQENIRKQAQFLQQQQQQLLQMQQSQKVEAQMKQLREERERLEKQRQTDELQKQMA